MEISVAAVTANKRLSKALIRLAAPLTEIEESPKAIDTTNEPFDIFQVVLMDEPETYIDVEPAGSGSRILQVAVGLPDTLTFKPQDDQIFLSAIKKQIETAVEESSLSRETKHAILSRMRQL